MGIINYMRNRLNGDYDRLVHFGRAFDEGWRPSNYDPSYSFSDWYQQYGDSYDVNEAINYHTEFHKHDYDDPWYMGFLNGSNFKGMSTLDYLNFGLSTGTALYNMYSQEQSRELQNRIARENNALSRELFYAGNEFNHQEALEAFKRSYEASLYKTQLNNMLDAGLNPAMMFGEGNTIQPPQSQSGNSESVPSFQGASPVVPQLDISSISDVAGALKALAEAKKLGVDTEYLEQSMKYRLKSDEANANYQSEVAKLKQKYGDRREQAEISKIDADIKYFGEQVDLMIKQEGLIDEQTLTQLHETYLKKVEYLEKERLFNAKEAYEGFWKSFVLAELHKMQNEGKLAGVQADWLPYQAVSGRIGAQASMLSASAQDYLAKHPQTWDAALGRVINGFFGGKTFEEIGEDFRNWIITHGGSSSVAESVWNVAYDNWLKYTPHGQLLYLFKAYKAGKLSLSQVRDQLETKINVKK